MFAKRCFHNSERKQCSDKSYETGKARREKDSDFIKCNIENNNKLIKGEKVISSKYIKSITAS